MNSLDDLELELRKLPGVKAAGFDESSEMLLVQLHLGDQVDSPEMPVPIERVAHRRPARRRAQRGRDRALARDPRSGGPGPAPAADVDLTTPEPEAAPVEPAPIVEAAAETATGGRRARLLAVLAFPDTDELEVHLILDGRRTIGRAVSSNGLIGAVEATIAAVRELGVSIAPTPLWARQVESDQDERSVVTVAIDGVAPDAPTDYGIAAGASPIDAAARSTLAALNRRLAQLLC